ncbi:ABC transporter substrate-binding protein [Streptomyces sp. SP18CS02]|uniref:ABC transporter substrate-binding protein n=1 Tax=Streptomyces sp. SP18CS02 TaxID=3002531 RepID=UPI002E773D6A|nr:ABC transporter substrate-binding protein [Streptomyces sp. SP18CS02]MEE1757267.1 ABC transporter substrate-binding protein [Streptomyces sp. SP18CS02]
MTASTTRCTTAAKTRTSRTSRMAAVAAIAVAGSMLMTGCGDQTEAGKKDAGSSAGASSSAPLFAKLPEEIKKSGVIKVGTDAAYAPMESMEGNKVVGIDPEIGAALGEKLGVKFDFQNGKFDGLIGSLYSGRVHIVMSGMTDNKDRQQGLDEGKKTGKGVDFVDYFQSGTAILVKKGNPEGIKTLDDLCGKKVAVQLGTTYADAAKAQSAKCKKDGKPELIIETPDTDAEAQVRVKAGGAVADLNDFPVAAHVAKTADGGTAFEIAGAPVDAGPFGIAVDKGNTQLRDAIKEAVDAIIADGTYKKILDKWGASESAIDKAVINGGK